MVFKVDFCFLDIFGIYWVLRFDFFCFQLWGDSRLKFGFCLSEVYNIIYFKWLCFGEKMIYCKGEFCFLKEENNCLF